MMTDSRPKPNGPARAAFIVGLGSLLPFVALSLIALLLTNDIAADLAEHPDRRSMISGDLKDWIPVMMVGFTLAAPAAATALGLGIWSVQRVGQSHRLGAVAIVLSSVVLVLGIVGYVGTLNW